MATFETVFACKESNIGGAAPNFANTLGKELSCWEFEGNPSHGAVPGGFANPDRTTQGALPFTNPATGKQKWLHAMTVIGGFATSSPNTLVHLFDRLVHMGGLDGTIATAQNVNGGSDAAVTRRYADPAGALDVGNEIWLEIYTAVGTTPTTVTCSYKNESGASKTTQAVAFGGTGNRENARLIRLPLAAGDRGVSAVVSVTLAGSTGTAGNFGIVVAHRLVSVIVDVGIGKTFVAAVEEPIEALSGACLFFALAHSQGQPDDVMQALPLTCLSFVEA